MADDVGNPEFWGITGVDGRLDSRWTPRVARATLTDINVPTGVAAVAPGFADKRQRWPVTNVYWETRIPHRDAAWWSTFSGWHPGAQSIFDEHWPEYLDNAVDDLIDSYGSTWHVAFQTQAETRHPDFTQLLALLATTRELELDNMYRGDVDATVSLALLEGPYRSTLRRRVWRFPTEETCDVCGARHYADTIRYYLVRRFGEPGVCDTCGKMVALAKQTREPVDVDSALEAIAAFIEVAGYIPASSFLSTLTTVGVPRSERGPIIACAAMIGEGRNLVDAHGGTWLNVLQSAGVVGDTWRPSRGTICTAADGHLCRSLAERSICDWLDRNRVAHDVEPKWPQHPELNPNGRLRADWQVGAVYIEFAGLMTDSNYAVKMAAKRALAAAEGIDLIVLTPEDLIHLDRRLGHLIADSEQSADV